MDLHVPDVVHGFVLRSPHVPTRVTSIDAGTDQGQHVPDATVPRFALAGDPASIRDQLKGALAGGIDQVAIIPYGTARFDREVTICAFADRVMAKL